MSVNKLLIVVNIGVLFEIIGKVGFVINVDIDLICDVMLKSYLYKVDLKLFEDELLCFFINK